MTKNIHKGQPILQFGTNLEDGKLAIILLHGRGATAKSLSSLAERASHRWKELLAPQAALNRWYPNTAFGPLETNEPDLTAALDTVDGSVNGFTKRFPINKLHRGIFRALLGCRISNPKPKKYVVYLFLVVPELDLST